MRVFAPLINLNGSDPDTLFAALASACSAIRAAELALGATAPNARDYQLGGFEVSAEEEPVRVVECYGRAARQHADRAQRLREVRAELELVSECLGDQIDERDARRSR